MSKSNSKLNLKIVFLAVFIVVTAAMLLISVFALSMPIVRVGAYVILATLLPALLRKTPIFLHGAVLLAQILAGVLSGQLVFVLLMSVIYVAALATLSVFLEGEG